MQANWYRVSKILLTLTLGVVLATAARAGAPYDVTVMFDAVPTADSYNFYIDDCAITGPVAAPFASVTSGQTFVSALTVDGTYQMCVRGVNAAGEQPNPGDVATVIVADLPLPGPINNLQIAIDCPTGSCTVNVTVN